MSITSQNALIGTPHVITTMRFLYDESFREIKGDIDAPANEAHAIGEVRRDRAGSEGFTKLFGMCF
ncbi:hypothetical protein HO173_008214 [Letharia columbiana]|uniref:Uncharacterized protein n=1 Tax=Letharia columbiana TaxID=112416 RepID=A0A8H6L308_9LECA|nr:uncharacterized protein HO173_008214 [Letharia columbiana]KAF6233657.1 hypothetical protein HO173_008214 [Letharia columbiana]